MVSRLSQDIAALLCVGLLSAGPVFAAWPVSLESDGTPTLAPLLADSTRAVVNVSVTASAAEDSGNPLLNDPFFRRFFEVPEPSERPPRRGVGSGVIVDADEGLILSNNHVVAEAEEISIVLSDRRRFDAEVVGTDPGTDIALLKIDASGLSELGFGDSDSLRVGDFVVAIGNPFGLGQTATTGIVSALGRSGINVEGYEDFIQTDASINPGNSGGALINLDGELVGINTAIISPAGGNVGIGFAVPSDMAREVMNQLLEYGEVRRGRLGVYIQDVTPALADALGLDTEEGAIVTDVEPGSPAMEAGIRSGDVIVAVDDDAVRNALELRNAIGLMRVDERVELTINRDGERRTISAGIGRDSGSQSTSAMPSELDRLEGAEVLNIPADDPLYGQVDGVLVAQVRPGTRAATRGLRARDVIVAVNREPVASTAELAAALMRHPDSAALTVVRDGRRIFLVLE